MQQPLTHVPFLGEIVNSKNFGTIIINEEYSIKERFFFTIFEIGLFDAYEFLYHRCSNEKDLEEWIVSLHGFELYNQKAKLFNDWIIKTDDVHHDEIEIVLSEEQLAFWNDNGYLHIPSIIADEDCNDVVNLICAELNIDLKNPQSWYPANEKLQGLMVQLYKGAAIEKNRRNNAIFLVFAQLYSTNQILPSIEKVSYNPPETELFKFNGSPLHWDIDFDRGPRYYIQGLIYLNDTPKERGAFSLIPKIHHKLPDLLATKHPAEILSELEADHPIEYLAGKKGDLILWLESIPHAATVNRSNMPRFVQYLSFQKL